MKPETNDRQFKATAPHFVVRSLKESVEYYHRALGFSMPQLWGDPPEFAMPSREGFIFMLKQAAEGVDVVTSRDQSGVWDAYIWINDADSLFSKFKEDGAIIEYEPCIREEYDMKEFAVRDPDGHVIAFGQDYGFANS